MSATAKPNAARRLAAETLGTAMLLAAVVGSGIMAQGLTSDAAVALLANTIAAGAVLYVLITILGPVSGAHFNPVVTLIERWRGRIGWAEAAAYILVQIGGAILGVLLAHAMFELPVFQLGVHVRSGWGQWLAEAVATFGLVLVIAGTHTQPTLTAAGVSLYITSAYWFTASTCFANPAVTLARSLTASFAGIAPHDAPAFVIAQFVGAALSAWISGWLFHPNAR